MAQNNELLPPAAASGIELVARGLAMMLASAGRPIVDAADAQTKPDVDPLLDRVQLARALNVSVATITRLARLGMPTVKILDATRYDLARVREWLDARGAER